MIKIVPGRNNEAIFLKIRNLDKLTRRAIRQGFFRLGEDLQREASRQILAKDKKGRVYRVRGPSGRRRRHRSSAPGQSHANLSGAARRSLSWKVRGAQELEFGYGVSKDAPDYVGFIEFGTRRMKPRPSLQNSIRSEIRNGQKHFEKEIRKIDD